IEHGIVAALRGVRKQPDKEDLRPMSTVSDSERRGLGIATANAAVAEREVGAPPAAGLAATVGRGGGGHGGFSLRNLRTFESFRVGAFRWFYGSMIGQMAAMQIET